MSNDRCLNCDLFWGCEESIRAWHEAKKKYQDLDGRVDFMCRFSQKCPKFTHNEVDPI